ncbi:MAG: hypothetical protein H0W89_01265 [Candidatus Levybacteria bacterium]|nr:hypothetical protein [Candidatus Levybacteria bacterium]
MDDLNPLDIKQADALNLPDNPGPQPDTFAGGGGAEREAQSGPLSIGEVTRLAGHIAQSHRAQAEATSSAAYGRQAAKYEGIHRVLSELANLKNAPASDAITDDLEEGLSDVVRKAQRSDIKRDPDKAAAVAKDITDFQAAIDFLDTQNEKPEAVRSGLKTKDEEALRQAPATSHELSELAGLFAQQKEAHAAVTDDNVRSSNLAADASDLTDVKNELYNAVHENGVPMTLDQTIAHIDRAIAEQEAIRNQFHPDSDEANDAINRLYTLEQTSEFVLDSPAFDGRSRFEENLVDARRVTARAVEGQREHQTRSAKTQDQKGIHEAREALKDEVLLDTVMAVGGFATRASLPPGYHTGFNGDRGGDTAGHAFDTNGNYPYTSRARIEGTSRWYSGSGISMSELFDQGVHEALASAPVEEPAYEEKTRTVKKGWFGTEEETYRADAGYRQPTFGELVPGADTNYSREPAVSLRYQTQCVGYDSRRAELAMTFVLPESVASEMMSQVRDDPTLLHRLVDRVAVGNDKDAGKSIGLDSEMWYKGNEHTTRAIRPPYDEWAASNGGKTRIYVSEGLIDDRNLDNTNIVTSK